jgi:hypothetical protein
MASRPNQVGQRWAMNDNTFFIGNRRDRESSAAFATGVEITDMTPTVAVVLPAPPHFGGGL